MLNRVRCHPMLVVLFDVLFDIFGTLCSMFCSVDARRSIVLFTVLFGTQPVVSVVVFERVIVFDVLFEVDMTHVVLVDAFPTC